MQKLYLASSSQARQQLIKDMGISYTVVMQSASEVIENHSGSFKDLLIAIAVQKMDHVVMPQGVEGDIAFVVTADTLGKSSDGVIRGKPKDTHDASAMIKKSRGMNLCATAFCVDRKKYSNGIWMTEKRVQEYVEAHYVFDMPDHCIQDYFVAVPNYLSMSGAVTIDGYGAQFLKSINGSYSTVLGLPVFELRQALERLDFFKS
jgi:septum formation protein